MYTDHPTVEIYFVFVYTFCKLKVYVAEETFARKVLEALGDEIEFCEAGDNGSWHEVDTRLLLNLLAKGLPKLVSQSMRDAIALPSRT
jgi:hypothetical protein